MTAPTDQSHVTQEDCERVASLCEERASGYGALRPSSLTAVALDMAAHCLRARLAPASEMREMAARVEDRVRFAVWNAVKGRGASDETGYAAVNAVLDALRALPAQPTGDAS